MAMYFPMLSVIQAALVSLVVVLALAIVEGAVLVRMGYDWGYRILSDPYYATVPIDCTIIDSCDTAVCLVRVVHREQRHYQYRIAYHTLRGSKPPVVARWEGLAPRIITAIPQSTQAVVGCSDGQVFLIDAAAPLAPARYFGRNEFGSPDDVACSPDGRRLLCAGIRGASGWDLTDRTVLWQRGDLSVISADFQTDGRHAALGLDDGRIVQIDASTGTTVRTIANVDFGPTELDVSPDGERLAVVCGIHTQLLDWQSGQPASNGKHRGSSVAFSPDAQLLASSSFDPERGSIVVLRRTSTGEVAAVLEGHQHCIFGARFAADGSVYSWSMDGTLRHWDPASQTQIRAIPIIN